MDSLCHPRFTTTNLSYRFPIFETSATALCCTTGIICIYICNYSLLYIKIHRLLYIVAYIIIYIPRLPMIFTHYTNPLPNLNQLAHMARSPSLRTQTPGVNAGMSWDFTNQNWLVVSTPLKKSQLEWYSQYMENDDLIIFNQSILDDICVRYHTRLSKHTRLLS